MSQIIETIPSAKRHAIKINDITLKQKQFVNISNIKTKELISPTEGSINSIAIFCNEYIPNEIKNNGSITYELIVNGITHNIVPINSNHNGIKIIKKLQNKSESDYVEYIQEDIKSAVLNIILKTPTQNISPYVSNLKILFGE